MSSEMGQTGPGDGDAVMTLVDFHCKRCGNCCLHAHFDEVGEEDIRDWQGKVRDDILAWVSPREIGDTTHSYKVWVHPKTGETVDRCPWLEDVPGTSQYVCQIYHVRPSICRHFPASRRHAREVACKGFDE